jgi:uncharacterized protein YcbK (DUF882 family)
MDDRRNRGIVRVLSRRQFVTTVGAAAPLLLSHTEVLVAREAARVLSFQHLHTGERLDIEYFNNGTYLPDALGAVDHLLRDFRTDKTHAIDRDLLDLLHGLSNLTRTRRPYQVISGYRSPATNQMLRQHGEGVALHSLHMEGRAIDIRLMDVSLVHLRDAALSMRAGGVGFYPKSDFVHVDTGRVRTW